MLALLNRVSILLIFPAVALAFFIGALFYYYRGTYDPPPSEALAIKDIKPPVSSFTTLAEPPPIHDGTLLVDAGHSNGFSQAEVSAFLSTVAARGYTLDFLRELDGFDGGATLDLLEEKLRGADSLVVIQPEDSYSKEEADLVHQFVEEKGGRLLLIADPTRKHKINSLAERFGIFFRPDYLYNLLEYDLNFQSIYVSDFRPDELTNGLGRIALYTSGSLESTGGGLAIPDANTKSTVVESIEPLYPMVKSNQGGVVAIADLTFMIPPQNTILDNPRLIANIADFLTTPQRQFDLADFPHFFSGQVDILLGRSSLLSAGAQMKNLLSGFQLSSEIRAVDDLNRDLVYLGLYDDAFNVAQYLQLAGVQVDGELRTPFTTAIERQETAVAILHRSSQRRVLVILGDTTDDVAGVLDQLESGGFRDGLVGDFVGVY
ncbi:MAG: hypothetical protein BZY88_01470 [SAR202 cluster bacterium Io17-Chloro-G9]|nr:MAG: hypothetical protein BZY88_01470 [SAR202 cluster bacterium Io17-Chloro-G9]